MNLVENVMGKRVEEEKLVTVYSVQAENNGSFDQWHKSIIRDLADIFFKVQNLPIYGNVV